MQEPRVAHIIALQAEHIAYRLLLSTGGPLHMQLAGASRPDGGQVVADNESQFTSHDTDSQQSFATAISCCSDAKQSLKQDPEFETSSEGRSRNVHFLAEDSAREHVQTSFHQDQPVTAEEGRHTSHQGMLAGRRHIESNTSGGTAASQHIRSISDMKAERYDEFSPRSYAHRDASRIPFNPGSPRNLRRQPLQVPAPQTSTVTHQGSGTSQYPESHMNSNAQTRTESALPIGVNGSVFSHPSQTSQLPFIYPDVTNPGSTRPSEIEDIDVSQEEAQQRKRPAFCDQAPISCAQLDEGGMPGSSSTYSNSFSGPLGGGVLGPAPSYVEAQLAPIAGHDHQQGSLTGRLMDSTDHRRNASGATLPYSETNSGFGVGDYLHASAGMRSTTLTSASGSFSTPFEWSMPYEQQMKTLAENAALLSDPSLPPSNTEGATITRESVGMGGRSSSRHGAASQARHGVSPSPRRQELGERSMHRLTVRIGGVQTAYRSGTLKHRSHVGTMHARDDLGLQTFRQETGAPPTASQTPDLVNTSGLTIRAHVHPVNSSEQVACNSSSNWRGSDGAPLTQAGSSRNCSTRSWLRRLICGAPSQTKVHPIP